MNAPEPVPFNAEAPQPLLRQTPPGQLYPLEALGPLKEAVQAVQGATQAPVAIPAASALTVASLAVQGFANVETLGGSRPVSLYALTIARSGERKSSCDAPLMAALRDFEREGSALNRDAHSNWLNAQALWKGDRDRILSEARKAKGEKRAIAEADLKTLGPEPLAPPSADRTVSEPTFEGLTRLFATGQPSLGIFSDEGGQFLGGHAMNSDNRQKTLAALNDLWQGNPIRRTRAGDGHATLHGRRLAVHLMVQPGVAYGFISDPMAADTGFLPRFLICEPKSTIGARFHDTAQQNWQPVAEFSKRLRSILETPMPMEDETRALTPRTLTLSSEARQILIQFSDNIESLQALGGELEHMTGFASKTAEHAARIAAVLALWRNLYITEVGLTDMKSGIELAEFHLSEAVRLADAANTSGEIDRAEKLRKWLQESWPHDEITLRDVLQRAPIRALRESPAAKAALALLEKHGWLALLEVGTVVRGSPRKEAFKVIRPLDTN